MKSTRTRIDLLDKTIKRENLEKLVYSWYPHTNTIAKFLFCIFFVKFTCMTVFSLSYINMTVDAEI